MKYFLLFLLNAILWDNASSSSSSSTSSSTTTLRAYSFARSVPSAFTTTPYPKRLRIEQKQQKQQYFHVRKHVMLHLKNPFRRNSNNDKENEEMDIKSNDILMENLNDEEEEEEETNVPFFARLVSKRIKQKTNTAAVDDDAVADENAVEDVVMTMTETTTTTTPTNMKESPQISPTLEKGTPPPPSPSSPPSSIASKKEEKVLSPIEEAIALRTQAERVRLEADQMEVKLTLDKVDRLEQKLTKLKAKSKQLKETKNDDNNDIHAGEDKIRSMAEEMLFIETEVEGMRSKLSRFENEKNKSGNNANTTPFITTTTAAAAETATTTTTTLTKQPPEQDEDQEITTKSTKSKSTTSLTPEQIERRTQRYLQTPKWLRRMIALGADFTFEDVDDLNATEVILRVFNDDPTSTNTNNNDYDTAPFSNWEIDDNMPTFNQTQIQEKINDLDGVPTFIKSWFYGKDEGTNDTAIAIRLLENEWRDSALEEQRLQNKNKKNGDDDDGFGLFGGGGGGDSNSLGGGRGLFGGGQDKTDVERTVEGLFPRSTRKEGQIPTKNQLDSFISDILSTTNNRSFTMTGAPEPVPGGFIIRGTNAMDNGDALIDALDAKMKKSPSASIRNLLQVSYVPDPTPITESQLEGFEDRLPVLFLTSSDIGRDSSNDDNNNNAIRNRFALAGVMALSLATTWYTSIYPYLLNEKFLKLAEEQLALADSGMDYNLDSLNQNALPIFFGFLGVQIMHEMAHQLVASSYGINTTIPTFIPSPISGMSGSITALQSSPKNLQALFDFAIAGPLTGIILSYLLLILGLYETATADASTYANFPALPLLFLRQSSLGGELIQYFLGSGTLDIPVITGGGTTTTAAATAATAAVATADVVNKAIADATIPLHPLAVAGYFSLLVNALSLLPFGRTDGGRVGMAMLGRGGIQILGLLTVLALFAMGLGGQDIYLFYFSYIAFFQGELDIPCRNEVDDVEFSRILLALASGVLVLLSILPMS